jgi:hypothetical protein
MRKLVAGNLICKHVLSKTNEEVTRNLDDLGS